MSTTIKQNVPKVNYELRRGDTFDPSLNYEDVNGATIDLSTWTARLEIRAEIDGPIITSLTESSGITLTNTNPNISILIDDSVTSTYTLDTMVYDLELTDTLSVVKTLMEGNIFMKKDVTI